jgi:hypothetical protein
MDYELRLGTRFGGILHAKPNYTCEIHEHVPDAYFHCSVIEADDSVSFIVVHDLSRKIDQVRVLS